MALWESTYDKLHRLGWSIGMTQYIDYDGVLIWSVDLRSESVWIVETGVNLNSVFLELFQKVAGGKLLDLNDIVLT